jgi:PPOX class probable F420-dependent enzyme
MKFAPPTRSEPAWAERIHTGRCLAQPPCEVSCYVLACSTGRAPVSVGNGDVGASATSWLRPGGATDGNMIQRAWVRSNMAKLSTAQREQYLADLHVGVIAVERRDRAPLSVPIWYWYEPGGEVSIWTQAGSVKETLIRAAGRFAITVQDEHPPYKYVTAEGDVTSIAPAVDADVRRIAIRYLGEAEGGHFTDQNLTPTSVVIRMRPHRWLSTDYSN